MPRAAAAALPFAALLPANPSPNPPDTPSPQKPPNAPPLNTQSILHVHKLHYLHMFDSVLAGPRPWVFGHLYLPGGGWVATGSRASSMQGTHRCRGCARVRLLALRLPTRPAQPFPSSPAVPAPRPPGGSANLGAEGYALAPGSQAPMVGVLMEVTRAVRLMDGKLLLLATAVARFKVRAGSCLALLQPAPGHLDPLRARHPACCPPRSSRHGPA
jgi:hypothetical protein